MSPRWEQAATVAGFVTAVPNEVLLSFAPRFLDPARRARGLDIGCGAARNALPLAELGFAVVGTDLSAPMLAGARERLRAAGGAPRVDLVLAPMAPLPFADRTFDLVVAHGIWNLAGSGTAFRAAVAEAARVARPGAGLFLFTFSRHTLPESAAPEPGETFVFSSWNGEPQCFLTEREIIDEMECAGFVRDPAGPLTEYNRSRPKALRTGGPPVIYEGTFVRRGPIAQLLAEDHRRLDALLDRAAADPARIDRDAYAAFREGLLRHIGMEEKLLMPAAARARGGAVLPAARRLRLDHGALAALLVPTPTPAVIEGLRSMLGPHDAIEEGPGGVYAACDELLAGEVARLVEALRAFPPVRVAPHQDGPLVEEHVRQAIARAREAWT